MKRLICTICCLTLASVGLLGLSGAADKTDKKEPSIKDLMLQTHKGKDAPLTKLDKQLQADEPSWADIQTTAKPLVDLGKRLEKYSESYTSGAAYFKSSQALGSAVEKKDKEAAAKAFKALKATCASCHREKMLDLND